MTRIISGLAGGRRLRTAPGSATRPTSDRVRESIFNLLINGGHGDPITDARVLDLFAGTGALGLELARAYLPDVILMDINLPGMSGIDALAELRRDPSTSHIPVLALTANAMPRDVERGIEAGFYRYLTKPINIEEFNEAIDSTLAMLDALRGEQHREQS